LSEQAASEHIGSSTCSGNIDANRKEETMRSRLKFLGSASRIACQFREIRAKQLPLPAYTLMVSRRS